MGASSTATSGFGNFKKTDEKEDQLRMCTEKAQIMRAPLIYKKSYVQGSTHLHIYNKKQQAKRVELEKRLFGVKDEIYDQVSTALKLRAS